MDIILSVAGTAKREPVGLRTFHVSISLVPRNTWCSGATIVCRVFLDDEHRQRHLQCLSQALLWFACRLHAHVLMNYHGHVLLTPDHNPGQSALFRGPGTKDVECPRSDVGTP